MMNRKKILAVAVALMIGLGGGLLATQPFESPALGFGGITWEPRVNHGGIDDPIPGPIPTSPIQITLETVATGLTAPNSGTVAPGYPGRLFVTDQSGILWVINLDTGQKAAFLDVSQPINVAGEQGLLGAAFHPDYLTNGLLYIYVSLPVGPPADFSTMPEGVDANHQSVVVEWHVPDPGNPRSRVDMSTARELMRIDQPQNNHNGGDLNFGPDGMLYISLGDGGAGDDQGDGHGDTGNGQDPSNVLGTILRIDPLGSNSANGKYGIPDNNPFVGLAGFVEEIALYGLRNPFRFSFDMATGAVFIGDVGQNDIEEVNVGVLGGNYGWNLKEGTFCFESNGVGPGFVIECEPGLPPDLIDPVAQYDHDEGSAVLGGYVYRGAAIPKLEGRYVFGDFGFFGQDNGRLFHLARKNWVGENRIGELMVPGGMGVALLGFGQDASGELYVMGNANGFPIGTSGVVMRIVPAP